MRNPGREKPKKMPKLKNMYIRIGYNEIDLISRIKKMVEDVILKEESGSFLMKR